MSKSEKAKITYNSPIHEFIHSVRRVGFKKSLLLIFSRGVDTLFDWHHGLDTSKRLELSELKINSDSTQYGSPYQPTGVLAFRKVLKAVKFPQPAVFVDYGCGKGRTLALAAMAGFETVIGIEFANELCICAKNNLAKINPKMPNQRTNTDVICTDATKYQYTDNENIFYFFYPFDNVIMNQVFSDIEESIERKPREAIIVEYVPLSVIYSSFGESRLFKMEKCIDIFGYQCRFFRTQPK